MPLWQFNSYADCVEEAQDGVIYAMFVSRSSNQPQNTLVDDEQDKLSFLGVLVTFEGF